MEFESAKFRVRIRARLSKPFNSEALSRSLVIAGREVTISSAIKDQAFKDASWIVFRAGGFENEQAAKQFGERLKILVEFAGICDFLGVDVGNDKPTSAFTQAGAVMMGLATPDDRVLPNVHGLMVMPDDEKNKIPVLNIEVKVLGNLDQFSTVLLELEKQWPLKLEAVAKGARLLCLAFMNAEPLGQMVLAISAIEELGQSEEWTKEQAHLIEALANRAANDLPGREGEEVADAMRRSLHKIGLRQGVKRVLHRLGLVHLIKEWDRLYGMRSAIFHGLSDLSTLELSALADETTKLCVTIMLVAAKQEGLMLPTIVKTHFPDTADPVN